VVAAGQCLAIADSGVRGVQRTARTTRVPGAPPVLFGIANLRGSVVTVLDLSVALEAPFSRTQEWPLSGPAPAVSQTRGEDAGSIVLLENGAHLIGVRVDNVRAVPARDDAPIAPPAVARHLVTTATTHAPVVGIVRAEGEDYPLLDVTALFSRYLLSTKE